MWKTIDINIQNIDSDNGKATLIKMPNNCKYAGYKFWHPSKLVRDGNNSYAKTFSYNDTFTFKLKKYGNGKWNKYDVIDEIEITPKQMEEAFDCMEDCTKEKSNETYLVVTEPKKVNKEVKINDNLKNEEHSLCTENLVKNGYL